MLIFPKRGERREEAPFSCAHDNRKMLLKSDGTNDHFFVRLSSKLLVVTALFLVES